MKARVTIELEDGGELIERHEIMTQLDDVLESDTAVIGAAIGGIVDSLQTVARKHLILAQAMGIFDEWNFKEEGAFFHAASDVVTMFKKFDDMKDDPEWAKKMVSATLKEPTP